MAAVRVCEGRWKVPAWYGSVCGCVCVCVCTRVLLGTCSPSALVDACVCESGRWAERMWHACGLWVWDCPVHTRSPQLVLNTLWTAH